MPKATIKSTNERIDSIESKLDLLVNAITNGTDAALAAPSVTTDASDMESIRATAPKVLSTDKFKAMCAAQVNRAIAKAKDKGRSQNIFWVYSQRSNRDVLLINDALKVKQVKNGYLVATVAPTGEVTRHVQGF